MPRKTHSYLLLLAPIVVLLVILPVLPHFYVFLFCTAYIFGMFALSLDFLMGYGGMPNFGQAVFFGLGAYVVTMAQIWWHVPPILSIIFPYAFVIPLSFALARVSVRGGGIYFALITIIWGDITYRTFFYEWTLGGSDGLRGATTFPLREYYIIILIATVVCYVLIRKIADSQFGMVLRAIRENETRMRFVGCKVENYRMSAFVISSCFATFAGSLYPGLYGGARPELLHWALSTLAVTMVIVGGLGSLVGALIGGFIITFLIEWSTSYLPMGGGYTIAGLILVATLLFMPKGIYPTIKRIWRS